MTLRRDVTVGAGIAASGMAIEPRATVMALVMCAALAFAGARRSALLALIALVAGGLAGLGLDDLPAATP